MTYHHNETPRTGAELYEFLGQQESQDINWGDAYEDDLVDFMRDGEFLSGATLPWAATHDKFRFRPSEVTIWGGMNGHRKSMLACQVLQWIALKSKERVGIMSFEMPVVTTQKRMVLQAAGSGNPPESFTREWAQWNHERICYYDKLETVPSDNVLGTLYFMAQDMGCKHVLIDSLTKCGLPYGERGSEKVFIDTLSASAKAFGIHIHLVCHVRKPEKGGEEYKPNKFDIRGAGEITDLVDNVLICWANKKKAELKEVVKRFGEDDLSDKEKKILAMSDQKLIVAKQRNGAFEETFGLSFNDDCLQFTGSDNSTLLFNLGDPEDEPY